MRKSNRLACIEPLESRLFLSAAEVIRNGGFEGTVSAADWARTGDVQADSRFTNFHTGSGYAYLATSSGGAGNNLSGTLSQQLTIPTEATSASLSFWHKITTSETTATAANDVMTAQVMNSAGTAVLHPLITLSNLNASTNYVQRTFELPAGLIGQSVRVLFTASTNASLSSTFRVDDVSLIADLPGGSGPDAPNRVVGYLPYYRQSSFSKIDLSMLTHINYFSIQATSTGGLTTSNVNDANLATVVNAMHAVSGKTVSITVGPQSFSTLAASSTARTTFANNLLAYCNVRNLDGVDIDWEPPAGNNVPNYGLLIDTLHSVLSPSGKLLTAAVNPWTNEIPVAQVNAKMDWLNVMCYDFAPANHSTYDQAVSGMVDWTNYGVQKDKIVMGVPFYGRSGTTWGNNVSRTYSAIISDYYTLHGAYPGPEVDSYVDSTGATFYFNGVTTMQRKAAYVRDNDYGGMMIWELGQDRWDSSNQYDSMSMLPIISSMMNPPNWLEPHAGSRFTYLNHTLSVAAGNVSFVSNASASDSTISLSIASGASALFNVSQHFSSLSIAGSATLAIGGNHTLVTNALAITGAGTLDLADNALVVDYSGAASTASADVETMVRRGYNGGSWLGTAIYSSVAASDESGGNYALGVADNASLSEPFGTSNGGALFAGVNVDLSSVLVRFTHRVDLNLDGQVTFADAAIFGTHFQSGAPASWSTGDLDYDGLFTFSDAAIFGTHF